MTETLAGTLVSRRVKEAIVKEDFTLELAVIREFKQIATATSITAVVDAVSWGEYVS